MLLLLRVAAVAAAGSALYKGGAVNATLADAAALALLAIALSGTGRNDALVPAFPSLVLPIRATFVLVSALSLLGLALLHGFLGPPVNDPTPYRNDAIILNECAAQALLRGEDPYRDLGFFGCYDARGVGPSHTTPLRSGAFAGHQTYPTDAQQAAAWNADRSACLQRPSAAVCEPAEFVWRLSYPSLSVLLILPWVALGWDTNVLYVLCLLAATGLILVRAPAGSRAFLLTGVLAALSVTALTVGGSADLLYALPLVAAWLWRERRGSALLLGLAVAVKQLAWPFAAFYLIQVVTRQGWREAARRAAIAGALFAAVNAPFVVWDPGAWITGILTPVAAPMFPRGSGLVSLSTSGMLPLFPEAAYLVMEAAAAVAVLVVAWRTRRTSPELGVVLAMIPLFFAWRSLSSYFFLLPLFAVAGIAHMPTGDLSAEAAREAGAVTVLAMPASGDPRRGRRAGEAECRTNADLEARAPRPQSAAFGARVAEHLESDGTRPLAEAKR